MISIDLISSAQRLYSIVAAPFLFFAFSLIIVSGRVVPRVLGYIGFLLGSVFFILGILQLFYPIQYIVNYFSIAQEFWWLMVPDQILRIEGSHLKKYINHYSI